MHDDTSQLKSLGSQGTVYPQTTPHAGILETFPNKYPGRDYTITHKTNEFTSRCPKTDQPDFAEIEINYIADEKCVESKSLKLYFGAYRNEGAFMESITNKILEDLITICAPKMMRVEAKFNARGGIATTVVAEYKKS